MPVDDAVAAAVNAEQRTALDPSTDPQVLAAIVEHRPDLRPAVAMNPTTYPALLEWLGNLNDPVINAALATREPSTEGAPPVSAPVPTVATAPPITAPDAAVPAPRPNRPVPAKRHPGLLIGAAAAIIILAGGGYLATQAFDTAAVPFSHVASTIPVGKTPMAAVDADAGVVWVSNFGDDTVSVIDRQTRQLVDTLTVGPSPMYPIVDPDADVVWVGTATGVVMIDRSSREVVDLEILGTGGFWSDPDADILWHCNTDDDRMSIFNYHSRAVDDSFPVIDGCGEVWVDNEKDAVYVFPYEGDTISVFDRTAHELVDTIRANGSHFVNADDEAGILYVATRETVSAIDRSTHQIVDTFPVERLGSVILDSDVVYITSSGDGAVTVVDRTTRETVGTLQLGSDTFGPVVDSDADLLWFQHAPETGTAVSVIGRQTLQLVSTVSVGTGLLNLAMHEEAGVMYASSHTDGTVSVIDRNALEIVRTIPVEEINGLLVDSDAGVAWVMGGSTVSVLAGD